MAFARPELLIPSVLALLCVLYPAPWHIRNRNIATLAMIFWMTSLNLVHIVNCIVWADNADVEAKVWCDISVLINMLYNYGLPLSHLILSRQIESCTSLAMESPLYSSISRRRGKIIDLSMAIAGPLVGFIVSLSARISRFDVIEGYGPMPGVYWDTWGLVWVAVVPIIIATLCLFYTSCLNIYHRRREMLSIISSNASVDKTDFIRLLVLAIAELGTLRAAFNMTWGTRGLARLSASPEKIPKSLTDIRIMNLDRMSRPSRMTLDLSWFTVVVCSFIFFLCFATSHETKRFYSKLLGKVCPPLHRHMRRRQQREEDRVKFASFSANESRQATGSVTAVDDEQHKDVSFIELVVGTPRSETKTVIDENPQASER